MEDYTRIFHSPRDRWVSAYKHKGKTRRKSGLLLVWLQRCYALKESLPSSFCHVETLSVPVLDSFSRHSLSASSDCILLREQFALRRDGKLDGNICELKLSCQGSPTLFMLSEKLFSVV